MPSSELRSLGDLGRGLQVGQGRSRGRTRRKGITARPRPRVPRPLLALLVVAAAVVVYVNVTAGEQLDDFAHQPPVPASAAEAPVSGGQGGSAEARRDDERADRGGGRQATVFATVDGLALHVASPGTEVAFLEATRGTAHPMTPVGELAANANSAKFTPSEDTEGPRYHVLPTQGYPWPATSAAALLLEPGAPVHAPVDGEVTEVARYPMGGGHVDVRVRLVPDDDPDVAVELRHLSAVAVEPGDRVEAGRSTLGVAREHLPRHPADAVAGQDGAPVRLEVRPSREAAPPDPNAPAADAEA
ncbi:MAG: M23 family metallopeptidase [Egibacteraceae bacterium]